MRIKTCLVGLVLFVCLGQPTLAQQSLNVSLFERYLVLLREQLAIPGLSAAIAQGGRVVWSTGLGQADVANALPARADTPYPVLGLTQAVSATLLLRHCVDFSHLEVTDSVRRWVPQYPDAALTIAELLSHSAGGQYQFDADRFSLASQIVRQCGDTEYGALLADGLDRFAMVDSVPGGDAAESSPANLAMFSAAQLQRYAGTLQRLAVPYRVDDRGQATPAPFTRRPVNAATGLIASAADLAQFDLGLRNGEWLTADTLRLAWTPVTAQSALGWFVQRVGTDTVVWQYGVEAGAYSSLMIKVPARDLTLVLLANSDALGAPHATGTPDVNASLFARLFFRIVLV